MNFNNHNERTIAILRGIDRYGNMTKIGEKLYLTQPYISRVIKSLETDYQVDFVDRSQHPLRLTYAGKYYLEKLIAISRFSNEIEHTMHEFSGQHVGQVTLGINPTLSLIVTPIILAKFQKQYPNIQVNLIELPSRQLEQQLANQQIDLYIGINNFNIPNLISHLLYTESVTLVYPHISIPPVTPILTDKAIANLLNHADFIETTLNSGLQRFSDSYFAKYNIKPNIVMQNVMMSTAFRMACAGIGATFIPNSLQNSLLVKQPIQLIQLDPKNYHMSIELSYHQQALHNESAVKMCDVIHSINFNDALQLS